MVGHVPDRGAQKGCMVHEQQQRKAGDDCNRCTGQSGRDAHSHSPEERSFSCNDGMFGTGSLSSASCGCFVMPHVAIDAAVLSSADVLFVSPVVLPVPALLLPMPDRFAGEPGFKIGASPPFMADRAHYTYLHTSIFLI